MTQAKRKRKAEIGPDARWTDPYQLQAPPCRFTDHHRRQRGKQALIVPNCIENPNCLYGLGEYEKGVWHAGTLLRRLLGPDPRERARGVVAGARTPCGLRNLGATCYVNSMLQCLFVNVRFRHAVYEWEPNDQELDHEHVRPMRALQKLFAQMQCGNESYYDPTEFASTLALNHGMQQDAQEFSKLLLAHVRTIFQHSRLARHGDVIDRIFQGQMTYVTKCLHCTHTSMRSSMYYEISLHLKGHASVDDCIRAYLAPEVLADENKYFCAHCKTKQCAERGLELHPHALPATLMVQLLRFVYDASLGRKKKITDEIEIHQTLNMTELLRRSGHAHAWNESHDVVYRLQAFLNHRGKSAHVGHYTACVAYPRPRSESGVAWFELDDAMVSTKEWGNDDTIRSRDVYMLLYVREDPVHDSVRTCTTKDTPLPSKPCQDEVEARNRAFEAQVAAYATKVNDMETRIQERIHAYEHLFEKRPPYPDPSACEFYWVDTEWLRCWVSGEEPVELERTSSHRATGEASNVHVRSNGDRSERNVHDKDHDTSCIIVDSPELELVRETQPTRSQDEVQRVGFADSPTSDAGASPKVRDDAIPFRKPVDVVRFSCVHSSQGVQDATGARQEPVLRFAPETVPKLKRISATLFASLRAQCTMQSSSSMDQQRTQRDDMKAFEAPTYRCHVCEHAFHQKLVHNVERLKQIEHELELLKGSPATLAAVVASGHAFFMSRTWIKTYKTRLESARKELTGKPKRGRTVLALPEASDSTGHKQSAATGDDQAVDVLNQDITCCHGNLTVNKRLYRPVSAKTWTYFRAKFPTHAEYPVDATRPCAQCQRDEVASKKCLQEKRDERKEILSVAALDALYHGHAREGAATTRLVDWFFDVPVAQRGSGLEEASRWTKREAPATRPRRLFLVSRAWLTAWRDYLDNVERPVPPGLTMSSLLCPHGKLVVPPRFVGSDDGDGLDASAWPVDLVPLDAMQALVARYGAPDMSYVYYGLVVPRATTVASTHDIVWRKWSVASLQRGHERSVVDDAGSEDASGDDDVLCAACQATWAHEHRAARENFVHGVVRIHQLQAEDVVPTTRDTATLATAPRGRRRSRRTRPRSTGTWDIVANASDSVYLLKTKLYAAMDALPSRQCLYFKGHALADDGRTLKECGIHAGSVVFVRVVDDDVEDLALLEDDTVQREVGFVDSVFHSHAVVIGRSRNGASALAASARRPDEDAVARPGAAGTDDVRVWVCPACTFVNDDTDPVCEMCSTDKVDDEKASVGDDHIVPSL
ncbi:hypothetical protein PsorP6_014089 [Peronosclerospora sorghi]|uniref:Uncharacterized protein n=1 Tax=Peronosclerospora sorghi TaxID=230839 RepID=A0ACC0VJK6_9STRA|nr:hypothetical protein PsorP6_014089 [Peronosclerospora sorghi]